MPTSSAGLHLHDARDLDGLQRGEGDPAQASCWRPQYSREPSIVSTAGPASLATRATESLAMRHCGRWAADSQTRTIGPVGIATMFATLFIGLIAGPGL